jgi:hypothetical protein
VVDIGHVEAEWQDHSLDLMDENLTFNNVDQTGNAFQVSEVDGISWSSVSNHGRRTCYNLSHFC